MINQTVIIKDIELSTQTRSKATLSRQFYVQFARSNQTAVVREKNYCTRWEEELVLLGDDASALPIQVYQKHVIPRKEDRLVGTLIHTIGEITSKLNNGVFEARLRKDTSDAWLTGMTIKFAFATWPHKRQATDGVHQAMQAINTLISTPAAADLLASASDYSASAITEGHAFDNTWGVFLVKFERFNQIVTGIAAIHPYASLAWSVISAANRILINQKNRDQRVIRLAGAMRDAFEFAQDTEPLKEKVEKHDKTITLLLQQVTECSYFISDYSKPNSFLIRTAKNLFSDVDQKITAYEDKLCELRTAFLQDATLQTEITIFRMVDMVQSIVESIVLNEMPYAQARYVSRKGCLPGTRVSLLEEIHDILNDPAEDAPRVCLLIGVAGSGKSAVAHSIARLYDGQKRLASSYCFASTDVARRNPQNLFSTIARDLCDHDPDYKSALWGVTKDNRALLMSTSPSEQLEHFIVEPSRGLDSVGSQLVVVIDALDQSGSPVDRRELLDALSEQIAGNALPKNLRFLITTRPESDILAKLPSGPYLIHKEMSKIPVDIVDGDIEKFVQHSIDEDSTHDLFSHDGEWCDKLVGRSEHLFQWAVTACKFIQETEVSPRKLFDVLLQGKDRVAMDPLYTLYQTILDQLFQSNDTRQSFQRVMSVILALHEPLSLASLSALFNSQEDLDVQRIVKPMGLLLDGTVDEDEPVRLHPSFRDFLLDRAHGSAFHFDTMPYHLSLGRASLACMRDKLQFNICNLEDSRLCNADIPDLDDRVKVAIPAHLSYACRYWMDHLQYATCTPELLEEITCFFKDLFPYWLEAISLLSYSSTHSIPSALSACTALNTWAKDHDIAKLASEASEFIHVFSPILQSSTPHLYLSAMPLTPPGSPLWRFWLDHLQKHVLISSGHSAIWQAELHKLQGHAKSVMSIAFSPDGRCIVSGSLDNTIRVWDVITGETVTGPLQGHTSIVSSVAYCPDSKFIVSGSWDHTVRVWNATTGEVVAGPFQGHTSVVSSVAYSPDARSIVSGSWDNTIRVWDITTGETITGPFQGHTSAVNSVAYSPDSKFIVSGSWDHTIRVWDVATGKIVSSPFKGHTSIVNSVAYSPNGKYIVSGLGINTIEAWDAITGDTVAGPFKGHTSVVTSVAYSPDGRFIVSGSRDNTIRVWDATTGETIAGPFQGHSDGITSIAYSPDGKYIVSGSTDRSIKVWISQALISSHHSNDWIQSSKDVVSWNSSSGHADEQSSFGESWISCWKI